MDPRNKCHSQASGNATFEAGAVGVVLQRKPYPVPPLPHHQISDVSRDGHDLRRSFGFGLSGDEFLGFIGEHFAPPTHGRPKHQSPTRPNEENTGHQAHKHQCETQGEIKRRRGSGRQAHALGWAPQCFAVHALLQRHCLYTPTM